MREEVGLAGRQSLEREERPSLGVLTESRGGRWLGVFPYVACSWDCCRMAGGWMVGLLGNHSIVSLVKQPFWYDGAGGAGGAL